MKLLEIYGVTVLLPIVTFMLGFIVSRFTMTKKERLDFAQVQFNNAKALMEARHARFQEFTTAMKRYATKTEEPDLDDFFQIATTGENYFYQLKITGDAILSGKVDSKSRDNTLVPAIEEAITKSLPTFYQTLQSIARRKDYSYHGVLKRENYESLYAAVEKFGKPKP